VIAGRDPIPPDPRLLGALRGGLPLTSRPFLEIARRIGSTEDEVIATLERWQADGWIRRFGVVVDHRSVGVRHNAMVVWDVPDADVPALGAHMARFPFVTLCYQRRRSAPAWTFNLYCMIHGTSRETVLAQIEHLTTELALHVYPREILFSRRRFRQRGAYYGVAPEGHAPGADACAAGGT